MKEAIHPNYPPAAVHCACGNTFVTRSTRGDMQVDVCSQCHPFYTGTQKLMDTAGRVDRFRKRYEKSDKAIASKAEAGAAATAAPAPAPAPAAEPAASKE
jgi:large subunit ribosomal protein L31